MIQEITCSHGRSHVYFTESIWSAIEKNCSFVGHAWNEDLSTIDASYLSTTCEQNTVCPEMGINSINYYPNATGIYFVPVDDEAPYCSELFCYIMSIGCIPNVHGSCFIIYNFCRLGVEESDVVTLLKEIKGYNTVEDILT